ncbi:MAG: hypothetical protein PHF23_06765 [Smithellaceae bacterium]|nr:hypothetical protein [Smithellaceae bacterium]
MAVAAGFFFTAFAQAAQDIPFSGFLGNPAPKAGRNCVGSGRGSIPANTNATWLVDSVVFFLAENADYKGIDPQDMKELCDLFNKEIAAAFQGKHEIVFQPGPDGGVYR